MLCRPFALRYFFLRALICLYEYCLLAFTHYLRITYRRICQRFPATI